ncbi:MAG: UDP-N-acetylmuramoyl-L-alanyl-D-glutamate--2,6-diaminopimelate ligase [Patescibacteria group bacterium]
MKKLIRKIIPKPLLNFYHWKLAKLANIIYGHPSKKMTIIGVTGTTGKSTTVNLIAKILEQAGNKVGLTSTFNYKVGDQEQINDTKMTMPGRFGLQKIMKEMVRAGCQYAVIETSSEGIAQYRHLGIDYDVAVFTNLSPEHIESHGSFANYKEAKGKLFKSLIKNKRKAKKISVVNLDDQQADYFLKFWADEKWGFSTNKKLRAGNYNNVIAENISLESWGSKFLVNGHQVNFNLVGLFNVYNALATICVGLGLGLDLETIKGGLEGVEKIEGRLEEIEEGQDFKVIVDYAHEPRSLESVYQALKPTTLGRTIAVLGSCGGGRDKARRPILGKLAAQYTDIVIVTNEDPYDEDPMTIIEQVAEGAIKNGKELDKNLFKILDRRKAINKALSLAQKDDLVIITGKGAEQCIMGRRGERISWDDRRAARELLKE